MTASSPASSALPLPHGAAVQPGGRGATLPTWWLDPGLDDSELLGGLEQHPALAAHVLRVANKPFYRQTATIDSLAAAVRLLGLPAIRGIAAAGCMERPSLPTPPECGRPIDLSLRARPTGFCARC